MNLSDKSPYKVKSAVLFVIFNRPDTTLKVFEEIKIAKPARLYIASDGPRQDHPEDKLLCSQARSVINNVDWECELKTFINKKNVGCKDGVSAAITWFFDNEKEGIILEDDCLPTNSFFKFCDTLLKKYRNDTRIRHISGCNLQEGKKWGDASYYFSNRTHVWGWASWRRVWNDYDITLDKYENGEIKEKLQNIYNDPLVVECWANIFNDVKEGKINSWAYPLDFINFFNNGLNIIPNENLVSNIGYGLGATNTTDSDHAFSNVHLSEINEITDPSFIVPEKQADLFIMNKHFNIEDMRRRQNSISKRIKRWFKTAFKNAALFI